MDWNEEMIARLRQLWSEGHSTAEIGRRMGITKNAVVGKAHRLALSSRPSPIRRETSDGHVARRSAPRRTTGPTLPALSAPAPSMSAASLAPPRAALADTPAPAASALPRAPVQLRAVPISRASARVTTCCWPIGDPGTASFRFCDDGAISGKPYCAQHAALAYVKVRDRREDAA
jgi:GcrA cell cycle regulator